MAAPSRQEPLRRSTGANARSDPKPQLKPAHLTKHEQRPTRLPSSTTLAPCGSSYSRRGRVRPAAPIGGRARPRSAGPRLPPEPGRWPGGGLARAWEGYPLSPSGVCPAAGRQYLELLEMMWGCRGGIPHRQGSRYIVQCLSKYLRWIQAGWREWQHAGTAGI